MSIQKIIKRMESLERLVGSGEPPDCSPTLTRRALATLSDGQLVELRNAAEARDAGREFSLDNLKVIQAFKIAFDQQRERFR
jgi:hypothetical protein